MDQINQMENSPLLKDIQEELHATKQILKAIFDSTKSSIFLVAPDYSIIFFNKWARDGCKFLYGRDMFVGDSILNYSQDGDEKNAESFKREFEKTIRTNSPLVTEREMHHPQMSYWVRLEYTPVYDDQKLIGVLFNVQNISDQKKFEKQNEEKHNQLNHIAWSQSHETRRPLASLLGLINIIDKESLNTENLELIKMLEENALKLEKIIQQNVVRANIHYEDHPSQS